MFYIQCNTSSYYYFLSLNVDITKAKLSEPRNNLKSAQGSFKFSFVLNTNHKYNLAVLTPNPLSEVPFLKCPLGHWGAILIAFSASFNALKDGQEDVNYSTFIKLK